MKILIIEDEIWAQSILDSMLKKQVSKALIKFATNIDEASNAIRYFEPDLIFMDIKLGSENSFEIINQFKETKLNIIFVTSYQEFAFNAFKVNAIDFLLKPVNETELINALNKYLRNESLVNKLDKGKDKLLVYKNDRLIPIEIGEIIKLKAENQYVSIHTQDGKKLISSKPLSHFENELDPQKFVRVHHSYIINLDHILNIKTGINPFVLMKNEESIPVSRRKKKELLEKFSQ